MRGLTIKQIGVLTKPDTIGAGSTKKREMWIEVLEGRSHPLKHGYYCTRQPDDDARLAGIKPSEARELEAEFFSQVEPWVASSARARFGTPNLVKSVSKLLTKIIRDSCVFPYRKVDHSRSSMPPARVATFQAPEALG